MNIRKTQQTLFLEPHIERDPYPPKTLAFKFQFQHQHHPSLVDLLFVLLNSFWGSHTHISTLIILHYLVSVFSHIEKPSYCTYWKIRSSVSSSTMETHHNITFLLFLLLNLYINMLPTFARPQATISLLSLESKAKDIENPIEKRTQKTLSPSFICSQSSSKRHWYSSCVYFVVKLISKPWTYMLAKLHYIN